METSTNLKRLTLHTDCRLILNCSLPEIIEETLMRNEIANSANRFQWKKDHPLRPTTLKAGENDYAVHVESRRSHFSSKD